MDVSIPSFVGAIIHFSLLTGIWLDLNTSRAIIWTQQGRTKAFQRERTQSLVNSIRKVASKSLASFRRLRRRSGIRAGWCRWKCFNAVIEHFPEKRSALRDDLFAALSVERVHIYGPSRGCLKDVDCHLVVSKMLQWSAAAMEEWIGKKVALEASFNDYNMALSNM